MSEDTDTPRRGPGRPPSNPRPEEMRGDMRQEMRPDDPRERAKLRAAQVREHNGGAMAEGVDEFHIDQSKVPPGWSYEWKMQTVLGKEDPGYQIALAQGGWEPVPASRHPEYMPRGYAGNTIERKGMILMERPLELTEEARAREQGKARQQVRYKEEQLNASSPGTFERKDGHGRPTAKVSKSYEPIAVPK